MKKPKRLKTAAGKPITKYFRVPSQDQENEVQDRNRSGVDATDTSQADPLMESPFANADAAPGGLTVEKTLQFIKEESKAGSGPSFLYSQEDVFEEHTPIARAPKKDEINTSEWRGWLKGCGAGTPKQDGTPRRIPWEYSPWTPKQVGSHSKRRFQSAGRKGDESVVRMVTSLDARLKNLYPSPDLDPTQSRQSSFQQNLLDKSNSSNDGSHPRKMRRTGILSSVDEETPEASKKCTNNKDPSVMVMASDPVEDWSDEDFLCNIPLELLEKPQAVVRKDL